MSRKMSDDAWGCNRGLAIVLRSKTCFFVIDSDELNRAALRRQTHAVRPNGERSESIDSDRLGPILAPAGRTSCVVVRFANRSAVQVRVILSRSGNLLLSGGPPFQISE